MMVIQEIFQKDIARDIKGVIKVEQKQEDNIYQELDEYVVTKELQRHFNIFYSAYNKSLTSEIDEMGVWISGFFGSGKSHFLKLLSYLLANKEVRGKKAIDFFESKINDPMLLGEMRRATQPDTDIILFNIDSKSDADSKAKKDAIVKVFMRVFNDWQGYCGAIPWLAEMERQLFRKGTYQSFQDAFAELTGESWIDLRGNGYFERDSIIGALVKGAGMSQESASKWFDQAESSYRINIDEFVKMVRDYCLASNRRVIFMVDEMGQYIGDNSDLMLNLQTVTEDLGVHLRGKAWVIVTSQEDIDGITKGKVKGHDFSKIIGRFATKISLSSSNTDEVIKRRILEKNDMAKDTLTLVYGENQATLRNLISFSAGTAEMKSYHDARDFSESYPFVTYQFNLLQKVFEAIRKFGMTGKHLSEGERSMLSAFQGAAISYKDSELDSLIPFDAFYQTVETFLDTGIKRVFSKAEENSRLEPFDLRVLRVLFMIKNVKEIQGNLENLTTLLIGQLDEDKIELRQKIATSLNQLQSETLIQQNGELYYFLTDEEQEINREIKLVAVDERDIVEKAGKDVFDEVYVSPKYSYSKLYIYPFNKQIDAILISQPVNELTIQLLTPYANEYSEDIEIIKMQSLDSGTLIVKLPDNGFLDEIKEFLRLEKYLKQRISMKNADNVQKILDDKGRELTQRKTRAGNLLRQAVSEADLFACGDHLEVKTEIPKDRINAGLEILVENVYRKLDYIKMPMMEPQEILGIIKADDSQIPLLKNGDNRQAVDEILSFIKMKDDQHIRVTMKSMLERFTLKPYGWRLIDLAGCLATLWITGEIKLQYNGEMLETSDKNAVNYLTKSVEAERLVISLRKKVDQETLNIARIIGREVFDKPYLSNEEDGMFDELKLAFQDEIQKLQGYIGRYETQDYPGRDEVERGLKLLKEIASYKDSNSFFQQLKEKQDELISWVAAIGPVRGFFQNQVDKFDEGRKKLEYYQNNLMYIAVDDVKSNVEKLQQILEDPAPYGLIKDIPYLLHSLDDVFKQELEARKKSVLERINKASALITDEIRKAGLENDKAQIILSPFETLRGALDSANSFSRADSIYLQTEQQEAACIRQIDDMLTSETPPASNPTGKVVYPLPKVKKTTQFKVLEAAGGKTILESSEDVEMYVEELRRRLIEIIQANKKVRLI